MERLGNLRLCVLVFLLLRELLWLKPAKGCLLGWAMLFVCASLSSARSFTAFFCGVMVFKGDRFSTPQMRILGVKCA